MTATDILPSLGLVLKSPSVVAILSLACCIVYTGYYVLYNIFFHPLAKFPGPLLARSSLLWRIRHSMTGHFHLAIQEQHRKLGPVVRISPNELSFASVQSWKDIYGHATGGKQIMTKSEFYDMYGSGFDSLCIGSERDPRKHAQMKKSLSAAFSTKALVQQESIVQGCVDGFVQRLGTDGASEKGLNMTKWFEMIAFDILGEMAFGESFHCVENGRDDFLTNISEKVKTGEVTKEEMTAHASTLVIAGGETVSTFLAAVTYFLLKNPAVYHELKQEIRSRFKDGSEITAMSAQQLPYLQAVISEGLRIYPPGSQGFPRTCPGGTIDRHWVPPGVEVYTSAWTVTHDENNFHDPYTFKPERWLDPARQDVLEASQPFSLGPRGCRGKNFALVEVNLIMAKMHFAYDLELQDKNLDWLQQSHMHVMWRKPAMHVRFHAAR
ncbi:hypothetical protein diail_12114 [Diaporthe ilicicola]|nr:hypothetical protein diail_12114 [Diaporthe ilicicola]